MMGKPLRCCNYSLSNAKESTTIHSSSKHGRSPIHNGLLCPSSLSIQSVSISVNLCQSVSICVNLCQFRQHMLQKCRQLINWCGLCPSVPLDHWESAHFTGQPCSWLDGAKEKSKAKNGPIGEEFGEGHRGTIKQVYGDRWCVYNGIMWNYNGV